jgi:hypothetical protein
MCVTCHVTCHIINDEQHKPIPLLLQSHGSTPSGGLQQYAQKAAPYLELQAQLNDMGLETEFPVG